MNKKKLAEFEKVYFKHLSTAVLEHPEDYPWAYGPTEIRGNLYSKVLDRMSVLQVADKMIAAVERGSFNKEGHAFKATCKELGIKHTYKAIDEFLER